MRPSAPDYTCFLDIAVSRAMKSLSVLVHRLSTPGASLILACAAFGLLSGLIVAMIQFSRRAQLFESHARVVFTPPPGIAGGIAEYEWMASQMAALRAPPLLAQAAVKAGMDKARGLTAAECAELLGEAVTVRVHEQKGPGPTISDRRVDTDTGSPPWKYVSVSMTSPHPAECPGIVNAIVEIRSLQLEGLPPRFLEIMEMAHPKADPVKLRWISYSWDRGLVGACAGLIAGIIWSRFRRCEKASGSPPPRPPATAAEF